MRCMKAAFDRNDDAGDQAARDLSGTDSNWTLLSGSLFAVAIVTGEVSTRATIIKNQAVLFFTRASIE